MPRLATYSAASYRAWIGTEPQSSQCANSGYGFPLLIPQSGDGYTLSQLGPSSTGAKSWVINTGYLKYLVNGQGKGVFGRGISGTTSPSLYMILYDSTGSGNYTYDPHTDFFQPGTPHEMGGIFLDNVLALGGGNEPGSPTGYANGTVRSWQVSDGRIVVLMGRPDAGYGVFQYFSYPGESIIRMQMSYTNTGAIARNVKMQRGGDPDWDQFPTYNGRGTSPVPVTNTVWSTSIPNGKTISVYTPGYGSQTNTSVIAGWPLYNPNTVLTGLNSGPYGDYSIYNAWNLGTVNPGETVFVTCFYIIGTGLSSFPSYIC